MPLVESDEPLDVAACVREALAGGRFFVAPPDRLEIRSESQVEIPWEIMHGHLLDERFTRERRRFETWQVVILGAGPRSSLDQPLITVLRDAAPKRLYVTRSILCHGWEPYEEAPNVIQSRPIERWTRELVATIDLVSIRSAHELRAQLIECVFLAVVGTSRLPITSLETPLPGYLLGRFGYCPLTVAPEPREPLSSPFELIDQWMQRARSTQHDARTLELALRSARAEDMPELSRRLVDRLRGDEVSDKAIVSILRSVFQQSALSPYTSYVDRWIELLRILSEPGLLGVETILDLCGFYIRCLARHLTAFDLVTFHNQGANYPDAPFLDHLLRLLLNFAERDEAAFVGPQHRLRRRALRQGWLMRKIVEGRPVPDAPTSPGESLRVWPMEIAHVPDEQIAEPRQRRKRLFEDEPSESLLTDRTRLILGQSIEEFDETTELLELGTALFLDRPLGIFKPPEAVDRTPLCSYVAVSRMVIRRRLKDLAACGLLSAETAKLLSDRAQTVPIQGAPVNQLDAPRRPAVVALEDALLVARDFVICHTTHTSLEELLAGYDLQPLALTDPSLAEWFATAARRLFIRTSAIDPRIACWMCYDDLSRPRMELGAVHDAVGNVRYAEFAGAEYLADGLRVLKAWSYGPANEPTAHDLSGRNVRLTPKAR